MTFVFVVVSMWCRYLCANKMNNMKQETITILGALLGLALIIGFTVTFYFQNLPQ